MAKGPGPALLLAGVAALFLLKGKKGGGSGGSSTIDPQGDANPDVGGGPADGSGGTNGGGSSGGGKKNPKTVPNPSGDPKGYNTELYPGPLPVRMGLAYLGYDIDQSMKPLDDAQARAAVRKFQKDYNAGDLTLDKGPYAGEAAPGYLEEDNGIAGKNVLNAIEIVIAGTSTGAWANAYN